MFASKDSTRQTVEGENEDPPPESIRVESKPKPRYRLRRQGAQEIDVHPGELTIGRGVDCGLRLSGGLVSRHHARLRCNADELVVYDLGSRNGVLVNGRRIDEPTGLAHGDVVGIGFEELEVIDEAVLRRPAHLSTLPPPPSSAMIAVGSASTSASSTSTSATWAAARAGVGVASPGEADVDASEQITVSARLDVLTEREREVLELIVLGHTQREIAQRLFVSVKTIETHRAHIVEKLGCHTRAELVSYAISAGLLRGLAVGHSGQSAQKGKP